MVTAAILGGLYVFKFPFKARALPAWEAKKLGLVAVTKPTSPQLTIAIKTKSIRCKSGQLDELITSIKPRPTAKALLSLEALGSAEAPLAAMPVSLAALAAGVRLKVDLPPLPGGRLLGLFLCSDEAGAGRCASGDAARIQAFQSLLHDGRALYLAQLPAAKLLRIAQARHLAFEDPFQRLQSQITAWGRAGKFSDVMANFKDLRLTITRRDPRCRR